MYRVRGRCPWEHGFVGGGFDYFLFAVSRRHMLPEQPCDVVTATQLPARLESPEKKQTQIPLVLTPQ